jgi:hypothetical protein
MENLQNKVKNFKDMEINKIKNDIDVFYNEIVNDNNKKYRLLEIVFVNIFLPFFFKLINSKTIEDQNRIKSEEKSLLYKWLELSGSEYSEVDIIDTNMNVLYTVPPIMANTSIENSVNKDFNNIIKNYKNRETRSKLDADKYIESQLSTIDDKIKPIDNNYGQRWLNIFNRYYGNTNKNDKSIKKQSNMLNYD